MSNIYSTVGQASRAVFMKSKGKFKYKMRKLNLDETSNNIYKAMATGDLYSFYGLTENADSAIYHENYVTEHFRFSCDGNIRDKQLLMQRFQCLLTKMQSEYLKVMRIDHPLFKITNMSVKVAPYNTIIFDVYVEGVKGAFVSVVNCAGPEHHQFHASGLWVRANETAGVWKSLYDSDSNETIVSDKPFDWVNVASAEKWLDKVKRARAIASDCIVTAGEPTEDEKQQLIAIMQS